MRVPDPCGVLFGLFVIVSGIIFARKTQKGWPFCLFKFGTSEDQGDPTPKPTPAPPSPSNDPLWDKWQDI
jgi:hypothetical protein